jgi:ketosteroid isomerase-like protein
MQPSGLVFGMIDKLTDDQKKEAVDTVVDCFKSSRDHFRDYHTLCKALQSFYNVELPREIHDELSADNPGLVPPDLHRCVNELVGRLYNIMFGPQPSYSVTPEENTPEINARCAAAWLDLANRKSDLELQFSKTLASATKYAAGVGFVDAEEIEQVKLDREVQFNPPGGGKGSARLTYTDFRKGKSLLMPKYTPIPITRYFPDFMTPRPSWAVYQSCVSFLDVLQGLETNQYSFEVDDLTATRDKLPPSWGEIPGKDAFRSSVMKKYNFPVELLHYRGWLPVVTNLEKDKVEYIDAIVTVANRDVLIQFDKNEWHYPAVDTFIMTYLFPSDEETLYPVGKLEASMDEFLYLFYLRNQRLMNLEFLLNPMWFTDSKDVANYLPAEKGRVHRVGPGQKLEPIPIHDITSKAYIEADVSKDEIRWNFHSNEYSAGRDPRRKETATGINVLKGATEDLQKFENRIAVKTGLLKILRRYLDIGQLFAKQSPLRLLDSNELMLIGKDEIFGDMSIKIDTLEAFERPLQRAQMTQVVELYKGDPDVDQIELKRRHFRLMEFSNVNKLVPEPKEKLLHIEKENMIMVQSGAPFPVLPEEPHDLHYKTHARYKDFPAVAQHMEMHLAYWQKQQETPQKATLPKMESETDLLRSVDRSLQPTRLGARSHAQTP